MANWTEDEVRIRNLRVFGQLEKADWQGVMDLSGRRAAATLRKDPSLREGGDAEVLPTAKTRPGQIDEPEALIQAEVTKFLESDGWRALRTDPVSDRSRGKGFGEIGMADMLYIRYSSRRQFASAPCRESIFGMDYGSIKSFVMWIEFKRSRGGVPSKAQLAWHEIERARGALTLIAGIDFMASVDGFKRWYRGSGLQRRVDL